MIATIVSGGLSFLFVILFTAIGTNLFKSKNIGQSIQEELNFHDHKKGHRPWEEFLLLLVLFLVF
jgi:hypothetical protein